MPRKLASLPSCLEGNAGPCSKKLWKFIWIGTVPFPMWLPTTTERHLQLCDRPQQQCFVHVHIPASGLKFW